MEKSVYSLTASNHWRMNMNKITIIDGNSLLFRAYYATAYPGVEIMRNQEGVPTNAIFAFSNMINKIINEMKNGEYIFVAFDTGKPSFRKSQLESYKANRKPAPEDLVKQFPIAREFLNAIGIFQFEKDGFEGDDVAGTVAKLAEQEGFDVHIYTSDRDFLQLVTDNITVHILKTGLSNVLLMTPESVKEAYGFAPKQIVDYKGLRGDASDNLPGIPGIGEKTAVKLIQEYGDFDNIIANASTMKGKIGENILAHQEIGKISRDLAIIQTDITLPFSVSNCLYGGYNFTDLNDFCKKYGFKQLMNKIPQKWKKVDIKEIPIEPIIIHSLKGFEIPNDIGIALDYSDDDYTNDNIFGISFDFNNHHLYMEIDDLIKDEIAKEILRNNTYHKHCYDFKAIKVALSRYGVEIKGLSFDLLIAAYLIDSSLNSNPISVLNLFDIDISSEENTSLFVQNNPHKTAKMAYYALHLKENALEILKKNYALDLYSNLELPLVDTLADMEIEGFPLDSKKLDEFGEEFKLKADALAAEIYELAGEEFNLSSPKQIGEILYQKLGLRSGRKMSTSVDALKDLINDHPVVSKILEYRKYFKLLSTYVEGLKNHIHEDGKIHAKFNQALTTTGRLSSSDPNLQNISIRDEEGKLIRKAFHYDDEYEILSLDYSQIELRILAGLSNCQALKEIFMSGEDIHSATAKRIFNLQEEPTDSQRRRAKTVNFGIVYGISDWGLAEQLDIPVKEAKAIIDSFYISFPEIEIFFKDIINHALQDGYVSTMFGRRRYLREIHDSNYQTREFAKRAAMNAPVQGTAADLIKIAMMKVDKMLKEGHYETKMVLQIHDELIFKVPQKEKDIIYPLIKKEMENAIDFDVPLEVEGGFGKDWYSTK